MSDDKTKQEDVKKDNTGTDQDKKEKFIPRDRFDEVYNRNKELETKLSAYESEKKKNEDAEALKRWEHEKVISDRDTEIASLKTQIAEKDKSYIKLNEIANSQLDSFKESYWEEALSEVKVLIWSDDPLVVLEKLPVVEKYFKKDATKPTGGSSQWQWSWWDKTRMQQFQERIAKGEYLSWRDREEYIKLLNTK